MAWLCRIQIETQYFKSNLLTVFWIILRYKIRIIRSQQLLADSDLHRGYQDCSSDLLTHKDITELLRYAADVSTSSAQMTVFKY